MSVFETWAKQVIERAQRNIGANRRVNGKSRRIESSGSLRKSLGYKVIKNGDNVTIEFTSKMKYAAFVNKGVSGLNKRYPTKFSFKNENPSKEHVKSIENWMRSKPLKLRDPKTGQFVSSSQSKRKSAAFAIARSIKKKGIAPTYFMDDAVLDGIDDLDSIVADIMEINIEETFNGNN